MEPTPIKPPSESSNLQLLTANEAARLLKTNPSTVYRMMQTGDIPAVRFGRSRRIRKADLEKFIEEHLTC